MHSAGGAGDTQGSDSQCREFRKEWDTQSHVRTQWGVNFPISSPEHMKNTHQRCQD